MMVGAAIGIVVGLVGSSGLFLYDYVDAWAREEFDDVDDDLWAFYTAMVAFVAFVLAYMAFSILTTWWYY